MIWYNPDEQACSSSPTRCSIWANRRRVFLPAAWWRSNVSEDGAKLRGSLQTRIHPRLWGKSSRWLGAVGCLHQSQPRICRTTATNPEQSGRNPRWTRIDVACDPRISVRHPFPFGTPTRSTTNGLRSLMDCSPAIKKLNVRQAKKSLILTI